MTIHGQVERRSKPRIDVPFPVRVRGVDASGQVFKMNTVLDNLSAGGLYLRLARSVKQGTKLFVVVQLPSAPAGEMPAPRVAMRGMVLRAEPQPDSTCGVAVTLTRHRFL